MGPSYPNEVSDLLTGATYAIQHAVTVTRPDPSRAEMAARIMAALAPLHDKFHSHDTAANIAVAMADALIAALEKAKP
jgi:predicted nucleic acid-binding protein